MRLAVIGVGHLGAIHARLSRQVEGAVLVGVADHSQAVCESICAELQVPGYADYRALIGQIDAAIIATPSRTHYQVASDLLKHGVHVFVEKPITLNVADAGDLTETARSAGLVLQVGHVERFNPAFLGAQPRLADPKYIEAVRTGPYTCRSIDVGVVLDLMIHDIDLALALTGDEVVSVEALGSAVIGPNEDWAQARLTFAGGSVANLYASRVSTQVRRAMQVICPKLTAEIDLGARQVRLITVSEQVEAGLDINAMTPAARTHVKEHLFDEFLPLTSLAIQETNPLLDEQREFVAAIRTGKAVTVAGQEGWAALDVAERVLTAIAGHRWDRAASPRGSGPEVRSPILRGPHWGHAAVRRKAG